LDLFYYPPYIDSDQGHIQAEKIEEISSKNFVIEGVAGQGKSILLRYLTFKEYQESQRIPIFIELRKLNDKGEIISFIKEAISSWIFLVSDELVSWVLRSGKIVLLLDGFDELKAKDVPNVIKDLESISQLYPQTQIVVTSRPDNAIQSSNFFKVLTIRPYEDDDRVGLIRKLVNDQDSCGNLVKALKESPLKVDELLTTPLMITLFVMTYRAKLIIPDSLSKFYEELFSVLIYKHDRTKPGYQREFKSNLNESELQDWFEVLCFISKNENKLVFESRQDLLDCIKKSISKKFQKEDPSALLEDITKNLCLIIRDGNNYSYIHRSIQEFFVASFFKKRPQDLAEQTYKLLDAKSTKYRAEIRFLSEIDSYRYRKYLLKPSLERFFIIYPNIIKFKSSIHISLYESWEYPDEDDDSEDGLEDGQKKYVQATINIVDTSQSLQSKNRDYLSNVLYNYFISNEGSAAIFQNLRNYDVTRFLYSLPILFEEIPATKVTKFFHKENSGLIDGIYLKFKRQLEECQLEIDHQEDQSFLDLI